jgi:hypothetical protein
LRSRTSSPSVRWLMDPSSARTVGTARPRNTCIVRACAGSALSGGPVAEPLA